MRRAALAAALGISIAVVELRLRGETDVRTQVAGQMLAFGLFLPAAWICWRGLGIGRSGVVLVLSLAIVMRAFALEPSTPPPLTTDTFRYAWDARLQAAGVNPYRYPPNDRALEKYRDAVIWPNINRRDWRTVYPPGAQASFLAARTVFGNGVRATTWLFLLAEAAAIGLLVLVLARMRVPLERIALVAWHPIAISEIAANGHVDVLAMFAGAALLAAWQSRKHTLAGLAVALGALVKLGPILLLPALARRGGRRFVLAALVPCVLAYLPYLEVGKHVIGSVPKFVRREELGSLAWTTLHQWLRWEQSLWVLTVILLGFVAILAFRRHDELDQVARTCLLVLGGLMLAGAHLQPWYAVWLLPFLVVTPAPAWLWFSGTLPLLYVYSLYQGLPWWVRVVIYGPFVVLSLHRLLRPRRRQVRALTPPGTDVRAVAVIPVINEIDSLPSVLAEFPAGIVAEIVVVDGGSTDGTAAAAEAAGVTVIAEVRRGYGRACLTGAEATDAAIVVFLDGDGSDDPRAIAALLEPIREGRAALVLGTRAEPEEGAQHWHQRLGNHFVSFLVRVVYGVRIRDIPPMRAVRHDVLAELELREMTYGWPTEMIVKTARAGYPIIELPVPSRPRRGGESKVSGRLGPSVRAGVRMIGVVVSYS